MFAEWRFEIEMRIRANRRAPESERQTPETFPPASAKAGEPSARASWNQESRTVNGLSRVDQPISMPLAKPQMSECSTVSWPGRR